MIYCVYVRFVQWLDHVFRKTTIIGKHFLDEIAAKETIWYIAE